MTDTSKSAPLVGRVEELAFVATAAARSGAGIMVQGPAGIGKTVFVRAAAASLDTETAWVQGTHAASGIMLGACANLLDPNRADATVATLVASLVADLRARGTRAPFALVVDDAHLLDGASATAIAQIVGAPSVFVILAVRSGEAVLDALTALELPRLALQPLSLAEVRELGSSLLEGPVASSTVQDLHRVTQGNPLFVRELVRGERDAGRIVESASAWHWQTGAGLAQSLGDVIDGRIGALSEPEERTLALLAYAGAAELALLDQMVAPETMVSLEQRELIVFERDDRRSVVRIAHPLYEEHLRTRTGPLRVRQMCGELIDALARLPGRRRADAVRDAIWRLQRGDLIDPDTLMAATLHAQRSFHISVINALTDRAGRQPSVEDDRVDELVRRYEREGPRAAEQAYQLARAAWLRSPSFETGMAVVLLQSSGVVPGDELVEVLARLEAMAVSSAERRALALEQAAFTFWHLLAPDETSRILDAAAATDVTADDRALLVAVRAGYALHGGDAATAVELGSEVYGDPTCAPYPRLVAAVPLAGGLCLGGRLDEGLRLADEVLPEVLEHALDDPRVIGDLMYAKVAGLVGSGRFDAAAETALGVYRLALEHGSLVGVGQFGAWLGTIALHRGHADAAIHHLLQADQLLATGDGVHSRSHILANLAAAYALAGDLPRARDALTMARAEHPMPRFFDIDLGIAEAWILAGEGQRQAGAARAAEVACEAIERGHLVYAVTAADVAARLGAPGAEALQGELATRVDGPLGPLNLERSIASRTGDAERLEQAGTRLRDHGLDLAAAETAFETAALWRARGETRRAALATEMAQAALANCVGARPPTIDHSPDLPDVLTKREREIVELARTGMSSPAIADQLYLSVRTVETHLYRAFTKLGISRRADLADLR